MKSLNEDELQARRERLKTSAPGSLDARLWGNLQLCGQEVECGGKVFAPNNARAVAELKICHAFPVVSAYGTAVHAGTVANSFETMVGTPLNYAHKMRVNDRSADKTKIPRDYIMGAIHAVEYPRTPHGGWKTQLDKGAAPGIRAVGYIFKNAEKVPGVLGEHLAGRHKRTGSMEMKYELAESGFLVGNRDTATKAQAKIIEECTPQEFADIGYGYLALEHAPAEVFDDLLACWDFKKMRMSGTWGKLPVVLMQGGINGRTEYHGIGVVRYGAEREAEISQILATDPDRLTEAADGAEGHAELLAYFEAVKKSSENLLTEISKAAGSAA